MPLLVLRSLLIFLCLSVLAHAGEPPRHWPRQPAPAVPELPAPRWQPSPLLQRHPERAHEFEQMSWRERFMHREARIREALARGDITQEEATRLRQRMEMRRAMIERKRQKFLQYEAQLDEHARPPE